PSKLPAARAQIWTLIQAAQLHHDLHRPDMPGAAEFDDFVLHVDGYLCEIKDSQIRDGLHILGAAPVGEARVNLVLAILRAQQVWGGRTGALPGLRSALAVHVGLSEVDLLGGGRVAAPAALLARHRADTGEWPALVGLTVWGTSAMRTQGDDIAEVLALLGCRPTWDDASRRVTGFEVVPLAELGRPRIDVTVRISGFFRDAFPHVITLLDDAVAAVAELAEPPESNYLRAHADADTAAHGDRRRAT